MSMLVKFTNPATSATYTWERNPSADTVTPKSRQVERTSTTGNVGAVKQQGDDGTYILDWQINILDAAMETALWEWYMLSRTQTIYVTDWAGEEYEVQIVAISRQRVPGALALTNNQYMVYEVQMEVYRFISGPLATAGVIP